MRSMLWAATAMLLRHTRALATIPYSDDGGSLSLLQPHWEGSGMLLLGDYHDDCAQTITLRQELPLLQPRPLVLFVEFSRLSPPQSREQIVAEYEELGAGYPCGEAYADLIVGARSLGIRVVGLYNPNVTIANLGGWTYTIYRSDGTYDQYVRSVIVDSTPPERPLQSMLMLLGSEHASSQRYLWESCGYSLPMLALMRNTSATRCVQALLDADCGIAADGEYFHIPCTATCASGCTSTNRVAIVGAWATGCDTYTEASGKCPG